MGSIGNNSSNIAIFFLSVAIVIIPAQDAYGLFSINTQLTEDEELEIYKLKQITNAEQVRDKQFISLIQKNPYINSLPDNAVFYEENNEMSELTDRNDEYFQLIKDEQISIAEEKFREILGGKNILNTFDEQFIKKQNHGFIIDDQIGFMKKTFDDFKDHKLLQISIAENYRDNNWSNVTGFPNPYQDNKATVVTYANSKNTDLDEYRDFRENDEFTNLKTAQISLAENIRNGMYEFTITGNPYLDESLDESLDGIEIIGGSEDLTFVDEGLKEKLDYRLSEEFETIKTNQVEIAQKKLGELLLYSNSEEKDEEIISPTSETKKPIIFDREDLAFEFIKNRQIDLAKEKLMEILGQRDIVEIEVDDRPISVILQEERYLKKILAEERSYLKQVLLPQQ